MLILNSGGTFNKRYNPISGELEVPFDNNALETILLSYNSNYKLAGVVYKDSLEIDINDRKVLANIIMESTEDIFVIVHGTDTINITAEFLDAVLDNKIIILVGSMTPFEVNPIEATFNFGMALGFSKSIDKAGVYICMSGHILLWDKIKKNKSLGKFEIV